MRAGTALDAGCERKPAPKRIYLETMQDILKGTNKIIIDSSGGGAQGVLPYLPLPELRKRGTNQ